MKNLIKNIETLEAATYTVNNEVISFAPESTVIELNRVPSQAEQKELFGNDDSIVLCF